MYKATPIGRKHSHALEGGRPLIVASIAMLAALGLMGCLGDERCGPGQWQDGDRCLLLLDAAVDAEDADPGDGAVDAALSDVAGCGLALTPEQLAGTYTQETTVSESNCGPPLPIPVGDPFNATTTISVEAGGELAVVVESLATFADEGTIETDGTVSFSAEGELVGTVFAVSQAMCFSDQDNATAVVSVALSGATGPICEFEARGTLVRQ